MRWQPCHEAKSISVGMIIGKQLAFAVPLVVQESQTLVMRIAKGICSTCQSATKTSTKNELAAHFAFIVASVRGSGAFAASSVIRE